jgi:membrane-associated protease RseP (regulator of RpoE activity)
MVVWSQVGATTDLGPFLLPQTVFAVWSDPVLLSMGLAFSLSALTILLAHELGHYVLCRRYGLPCTLPYFLPMPFNFGTLGAFIRIKAQIRTKSELFDVGIAGPIAGFVALVPFLVYGVAHSHFARIPSGGSFYKLGHPFALELVARLFHGAAPPGTRLDLHPVAVGAWLGLFATALNLLPLGQLDGGHILYAVLGRTQRRLALPLALLLGGLGFLWRGWWLWCFLVLILGLFHPPVRDETEPLDGKRKALAWLALALLVLSFSPAPIDLVALH